MTEDDKASPEPEPSPKSTSVYKSKEKRDKSRLTTKIVCRRLPPTMTEESFLEQVSPIPDHDFFYFAKPDQSLTPDLFSRAYINFVSAEDIFIFRDKFDDYIFLDEKGNEYPAIVEYAPFQRLPKKRRKKDPKSGTIESDPTYLEFLESLKETDSDSREPKMEYSYQITEEKKETTTPLLEFLAARRREDRRRKEERQKRRTRNRNSKDDDIQEEDIKKIKPREVENEKSSYKKRDDDVSNARPDTGEKDSKFSKGGKSYRDQRKSAEDQRKKTDHEKKDFNKGKENDYAADEKGSRRERRDRQREFPKEKGKEVKKYSDSRREKMKSTIEKKTEKLPSFRQIDETEQDEIISITIENKTFPTNSTHTTENASENKVAPKAPLDSSHIKPFTQLPQYKGVELSKAIDELDKSKVKIESNAPEEPSPANEVTQEARRSDTKPFKKPAVISSKGKLQGGKNDSENKKDVSKEKERDIPKKSTEECKSAEKANKSDADNSSAQQRRSSLESSEVKSPSDDTPLRRHKSLDDKSQDSNDDGCKPVDLTKSSDPRKERRIRNKDRPSIVIYQPGMGKFSKQRLERVKDSPTGTYKQLDSNSQTKSNTESANSTPDN